jgi:hypothetical protein
MHVEQSLYVFAGRHVASCSSAGRVRRLAWQGAWQQGASTSDQHVCQPHKSLRSSGPPY